MTTLEKIIKVIKDNIWYSLLVFIIITVISLIPIGLYFYTFHDSLSTDHTKWASFGTFFGGIYGPIATLVSVIVLIITVIEINQSNKISIENQNNVNIINEIVKFTDIFNACLDKNELIPDRNYFFNWLNGLVTPGLKFTPPSSQKDIFDVCVNKFKPEEIKLFQDEIYILEEIISRINIIENKVVKERAISIFKGVIPNTERFWIECYARRFRPNIAGAISSLREFSYIPKDLHESLNDPELL
ncbi:hypothetical protein ACSJES_003788 [Yersinia enterocolitica]